MSSTVSTAVRGLSLSRRGLIGAAVSGAIVGGSSPASGDEIRPPDNWALDELFVSDEAWEAERSALERLIPDLRAKSVDTTQALKQVLDRRYEVSLRVWRLVLYAVLRSDEDIRVAVASERRAAAFDLQARVEAAQTWISNAVIELGSARIDQMLSERNSGLGIYAYPLSAILRRAPHTLDEAGETLLAAASPVSQAPQTIRQTLLSSDIAFPEVEIDGKAARVDLGAYERIMTTRPRPDRARAYDAYARTIRTYERTFGAVLGARVAANVFAARARRYDTALDASLDATGTPRAVYDTLIGAVRGRLPLHHRYLEVKRRLMGIDRLAAWDTTAPARASYRRWTLAEARNATLQAVAPLGPAYVRSLAENTLKPWSDALPRTGKREGGYVAGQGYAHPYVLLNHSGDFASLSTYAHEWGHAQHSWLARSQPYPLYEFPTFVAEIPSKVNELLLLDDLVSGATTREDRIFYLDRLCEQYRGTLFIQSMFAEFELDIHAAAEAGRPMSGPQMSRRYAELMSTYLGPGVELHPDTGALWATVLHFYLNFYVFQYATCLVAATAFVDSLGEGGSEARDRYLNLLRAGGSDDAWRLVARAGIDLTTEEPYGRTLDRFSRAINELEQAAA